MGWQDILFFLILVGIAAFVLYRTLRRKKWCPAIYGSGDREDRKDPPVSETRE